MKFSDEAVVDCLGELTLIAGECIKELTVRGEFETQLVEDVESLLIGNGWGPCDALVDGFILGRKFYGGCYFPELAIKTFEELGGEVRGLELVNKLIVVLVLVKLSDEFLQTELVVVLEGGFAESV